MKELLYHVFLTIFWKLPANNDSKQMYYRLGRIPLRFIVSLRHPTPGDYTKLLNMKFDN